MIKKAESYQVDDIFKKIYTIPPYQREYAWGKEQWENLFTDILENSNGYFLGSLICINKNDSEIFEVIDGQQRLTTISILKNAMLATLDERWIDRKDFKQISKFQKLKESIYDEEKELLRLKLSIQNLNNEDYEYLCSQLNYNNI
jgi:uncharacterized protein with ParB-like and HNH nuclease domain